MSNEFDFGHDASGAELSSDSTALDLSTGTAKEIADYDNDSSGYETLNDIPDISSETETAQPEYTTLDDIPSYETETTNTTADITDLSSIEDDPPKVLKRDITPEILESRELDTAATLENYRDNLRDYGVSEDKIEAFVQQEKVKIDAEYASLDSGDTSSNIYYTPTNWEEIASSLKDDSPTSGGTISKELTDVQNINDISGWLGDINPNFDEFDPESPYCNNCGSCAFAVYNRLNGDTDMCATAENIGYNDEMNALTGMEQVSMSPEEIESRLLEQGDGAHAIIGIDRAEGAGHWFNAACVDGKVVAIDGQTGEIQDWPPDYGDVVNWEMSVKKGD